MRIRSLALIAASLSVAGCYDAHGTVPDTSVSDIDAGCPSIAGYPRCGEGCGGWACPGEREVCSYPLEVCAVRQTDASGTLDRRVDICGIRTEPPIDAWQNNSYYCADDRICVGTSRAIDEDGFAFQGQCLREEYCDEAAGVIDDYVCMWSDLSRRVTGAPVETSCPPSDPRAGLCGGPCADCPWDPPPYWEATAMMFQVACVGRSDRRGLGICAQHTHQRCIPGTAYTPDFACLTGTEFPLFPDGARCACLLLENPSEPGTFHEWGWATLASTCTQYRALYPGQVSCLDGEWNELE